MNTTWILAADGTRARFFESLDGKEVHELDDMINAHGRDAKRDINTDREGSWHGGGTAGSKLAGHAYEKDVDPLKHEETRFAQDIGEFLDKASMEHKFDKLCVIAPPEFMGRLRENMGQHARDAIKEELVKDITWFSEAEVEKYVQQHIH